jgi:hypothetical protein
MGPSRVCYLVHKELQIEYQLVVDLVWLSSRDQRSARDDYSNRWSMIDQVISNLLGAPVAVGRG